MPTALLFRTKPFSLAVLAVLLALTPPLNAGSRRHHHSGISYSLHLGHYGGHHYGYGYGLHGYGYRPYAYSYRYYPYPDYGYDDYDDSVYLDTYTDSRDSRNNWRLLASGRYRQAMDGFSREAKSYPDKGTPKIGYALTAAASGDLRKGVWAMRRAAEYDPQALRELRPDSDTVKLIDDLQKRYHNYRSYNLSPKDAGFMITSLHLLRGDDTEYDALAPEDRARSTENLRQLIR